MKTIAVIPAYNEQKYLGEVISSAKKYVNKVIVVDDGSIDSTPTIGKKADTFLKLVINMGKGFALKTGCDEAISQKADFIIMLDADGQHDPSEIPKIMDKLKTKDIVIGTRGFMNMPLGSKIGNIILSTAFRILFFQNVRDTQSGFRGFKSNIYNSIVWRSNRYGVETEMLANAAKNRIKIGEAEIKTIYHEVHKGTTFIDGIKIMLMMLFWRLSGRQTNKNS